MQLTHSSLVFISQSFSFSVTRSHSLSLVVKSSNIVVLAHSLVLIFPSHDGSLSPLSLPLTRSLSVCLSTRSPSLSHSLTLLFSPSREIAASLSLSTVPPSHFALSVSLSFLVSLTPSLPLLLTGYPSHCLVLSPPPSSQHSFSLIHTRSHSFRLCLRLTRFLFSHSLLRSLTLRYSLPPPAHSLMSLSLVISLSLTRQSLVPPPSPPPSLLLSHTHGIAHSLPLGLTRYLFHSFFLLLLPSLITQSLSLSLSYSSSRTDSLIVLSPSRDGSDSLPHHSPSLSLSFSLTLTHSHSTFSFSHSLILSRSPPHVRWWLSLTVSQHTSSASHAVLSMSLQSFIFLSFPLSLSPLHSLSLCLRH